MHLVPKKAVMDPLARLARGNCWVKPFAYALVTPEQCIMLFTTSFTARLYGRRRASRKKTQLLAALEVN